MIHLRFCSNIFIGDYLQPLCRSETWRYCAIPFSLWIGTSACIVFTSLVDCRLFLTSETWRNCVVGLSSRPWNYGGPGIVLTLPLLCSRTPIPSFHCISFIFLHSFPLLFLALTEYYPVCQHHCAKLAFQAYIHFLMKRDDRTLFPLITSSL